METTKIKKNLQKVISNYRKTASPDGKFPKAMMTGAQMDKGQATINCGGEWRSADRTWEMAADIMAEPEFQDFLKDNSVRAQIEYNKAADAFQIRLYF